MHALDLDRESSEWVRHLTATGEVHRTAVARLHALLLGVARGAAARRRATLPDRGSEEVGDLCVQAANDALVAVLGKLDTYRGNARFTTWACKFVILEISSALRRHAWRHRKVELDDTVWDRLPDGAPPPLERIQNAEVLGILARAVREQLTERQRLVFQSVTLDDVPIDVLAERLGSTRGAIYKTLHDARGKLRRVLADAGYEDEVA
ncbi:MAG TPA: sigma-70 family RNA polymerase sigma factor [Gemmatimonadaceae bacterium]|jgi:RNA polymerase sigma-70 factor (ECF subfamily)|nr:sigma-70 family RNA polymerase sigma factor [Gemmatimonadaceae bacterium]